MANKKKESSRIELMDALIPIICICWILVFGYISVFIESGTLALITVVPIIFLYAVYLIGSSVYIYKELEILTALDRDTTNAQKKYRNKKPQLNISKLVIAGICVVLGIILCIIL